MLPVEDIRSQIKRAMLGLVAVVGLALVYLFQQTDIVYLVTGDPEQTGLHFAVNRGVRLLLNDVFMLLFIAVWFQDRSITKLALVIQLIDFFLLLPLTFLLNCRGKEALKYHRRYSHNFID